MSGFDQPSWFWLLALVPLLAVFHAGALHSRRAALARLLVAGVDRLSVRVGRFRRALEASLWALTVGLVVLALAGPRWGLNLENVSRSGADLVVVIDASRSMLARDVTPSRLERARREVRGLLEAAPGARVALVTYAGDARVLCPLTLDHDTVSLFLDEIDPVSDHRGGSSLAAALRVAGEAAGGGNGAGRAIVVVGDGEDLKDPTGSAAAAVAAKLSATGVRVFTLGIGTEAGTTIPVVDEGTGAVGTFRDAEEREVRTKLAPGALAAIALAGEGRYVSTATTAFPMDELWRSRLSRLAKGDSGQETLERLTPRFQWFLLPAILVAALAWVAPFQPVFSSLAGEAPRRRPIGAVAAVAAAAVLLAMALAIPRIARADAVEDGATGDALYKKGDYAAAAAAYESAARGVETEHATFNLGNARFRQKQYRAAAKSWAEAEKRAAGPEARRDASYNRAVALMSAAEGEKEQAARTDTLKGSIDAFNAALRLDPTDAAAREGRAIAIARWVETQRADTEKQKPPKDGKKKDDPNALPGDDQKQQQANGGGEGGKGKPDEPGEKSEEPGGEGKGDQPGGTGKQGEPPPAGDPGEETEAENGVAAEDLERVERMLEAREREQRRLEKVKSKMRRRGGEFDW